MVENNFIEYTIEKKKYDAVLKKKFDAVLLKNRTINGYLRSDLTLDFKYNLINKYQRMFKAGQQTSPFFVESPKFKVYLEAIDSYYLEFSKLLSPKVLELFNKITGPLKMSLSLMSVRSLCRILNNLLENKSISKTNMIMIMSTALMSVIHSEDYKVYEIKKDDRMDISKSDLLHLGTFLVDGLVHAKILVFDKLKVTITSEASIILLLANAVNTSHPAIRLYPKYTSEVDYYYSSTEDYYTMVHLNDSTGVKKLKNVAGNLAYEAINYTQSLGFRVCHKTLAVIENNLYDSYMKYSEGVTENANKNIPLGIMFNGSHDVALYCKSHNTSNLKSMIKDWYVSNYKIDIFLSTLALAKIYLDHVLYFRNFYDWRGRLYSDGFPINPQGSKLARSLLITENYKPLVGIDVTASGFQIMGLIVACEKTLKLTNFFKSDGESDIYMFNLKFLLEWLNGRHDLCQFAPMFDRKFYKDLLMCFIYSETHYSRIDKITDRALSFLGIYVINEVSKEISMKLVELYNTHNSKLASFTADLLFCVSRHHKLYNIKSEYIKKLKMSAKPAFIKCVSVYPKQVSRRISYKNYKSGKTVQSVLKLDIFPLVNCIRKTKAAIGPNFIHNLDATILNSVILSCKKSNIPLFTVHDCFYVPESDTQNVKRFYYEACRELFSTNPMVNFIIDNDIPETSILEVYQNNTKFLEKLFQSNQMSDLILKV